MADVRLRGLPVTPSQRLARVSFSCRSRWSDSLEPG